MTPQQKAENIALLARLVMGWPDHKFVTDPAINATWCARCGVSESQIIGPCQHQDWDPYVNPADALEMLEGFAGELNWSTTHASCRVWRETHGGYGYGSGPTKLDAICAACLEWARAQGEKK